MFQPIPQINNYCNLFESVQSEFSSPGECGLTACMSLSMTSKCVRTPDRADKDPAVFRFVQLSSTLRAMSTLMQQMVCSILHLKSLNNRADSVADSSSHMFTRSSAFTLAVAPVAPQRAEADVVAQNSGTAVLEAEVRSARPSPVRVHVHIREKTHRQLQVGDRAPVPLREHDGASLGTPKSLPLWCDTSRHMVLC